MQTGVRVSDSTVATAVPRYAVTVPCPRTAYSMLTYQTQWRAIRVKEGWSCHRTFSRSSTTPRDDSRCCFLVFCSLLLHVPCFSCSVGHSLCWPLVSTCMTAVNSSHAFVSRLGGVHEPSVLFVSGGQHLVSMAKHGGSYGVTRRMPTNSHGAARSSPLESGWQTVAFPAIAAGQQKRNRVFHPL